MRKASQLDAVAALTEGYIRALLNTEQNWSRRKDSLGLSSLAADTISRCVQDCTEFNKKAPLSELVEKEVGRLFLPLKTNDVLIWAGANFWRCRNFQTSFTDGGWPSVLDLKLIEIAREFPPLSVYVVDERICFRS